MKNTSIQAYKNFMPKIGTDQYHILSVMKKDQDMTYKELGYAVYKKLLLSNETRLKAFAWKYDPNKVSRRMKELIDSGKVRLSQSRLCTRAKSNCSAYILI
ncbi:MAG: hypothetical protein ACPGRW_06025 [Flavobacteriaceae bacterium]